MPPHCDTLDGPVVEAARRALEAGNVNLILPVAPKTAEKELRHAFEETQKVRKQGKEAMELADRWFFETAVRLHREGEGASYTGLKPAGLDWGPVIPKAETAIQKEKPDEVIRFLTQAVEDQLRKRFDHALQLKGYSPDDVDKAREYTSAMLGFELYSHHLYTAITGSKEHGSPEETGEHEQGHSY